MTLIQLREEQKSYLKPDFFSFFDFFSSFFSFSVSKGDLLYLVSSSSKLKKNINALKSTNIV